MPDETEEIDATSADPDAILAAPPEEKVDRRRRVLTPLTPEQQELVAANKNLAPYMAGKFAPSPEVVDDMAQIAMFQLSKCAQDFDPSRGVPFGAYAANAIKLTFKNFLRKYNRDNAMTPISMDEPIGTDSAENEVTRHDLVGAGGNALASVLSSENVQALQAVVGTLPERYRTILTKIYWEDKSLRDIQAEMHISHMYVSTLHKKALTELRRALIDKGITTGVSESMLTPCTDEKALRSEFKRLAEAFGKQNDVRFGLEASISLWVSDTDIEDSVEIQEVRASGRPREEKVSLIKAIILNIARDKIMERSHDNFDIGADPQWSNVNMDRLDWEALLNPSEPEDEYPE